MKRLGQNQEDRSGKISEFQPTQPLVRGTTLLEASAGTGKTYNITNIVLRLVVEEALEISEILIVTFSKAATAELRERTRQRISEAIEALNDAFHGVRMPDEDREPVLAKLVGDSGLRGEETTRRELQRRIALLMRARESFDEAAISTIHGFCERTLRHAAFESGLDFGAELVKDLSGLRDQIVDDFQAIELRGAGELWCRYLTEHAKITRSDLVALAATLESNPEREVIPVSPLGGDDHDNHDDPIRPLGESFDARLTQSITVFYLEWEAGGREQAKKYFARAIKAKAFVRTASLGNARQSNSRAKALDDLRAGDPAHETMASAATITYFAASTITSKLAGGGEVPHGKVFDLAQAVADLISDERGLAYKRRFVAFFIREFEDRKRRDSLLSFDDLLRVLAHQLGEAGSGERLKASMRGRHQAALIDEFQDTDAVQWKIFSTVFADDAFLYLIGDPKQAIYSFRGADIETYLRAQRAANDRRFTMSTNWRSDEGYIAALNTLLDQRGVFGQPGIDYVRVNAAPGRGASDLQWPTPGAEGHDAPFQLRFVPRALVTHEESKPMAAGLLKDRLPGWVATDIVKLLMSGARLNIEDSGGKETRVVGPRDLAVIVRTHAQASAIQNALRAAHVPSVISGAGSVFAGPEASALQALLEVLVRPRVESAVKTALVSMIFSVDANELLALDDRDWERWLERFLEWGETWRRYGCMAALRKVFAEVHLPRRLLGQRGGERAMTNLLHLAELLHGVETRDRLASEALGEWLRTRRNELDSVEDDSQLRLETDADAVTVTTIHRSKGLEYPLVWCPYLWEGLGVSSRNSRHLLFNQVTQSRDEKWQSTPMIDIQLNASESPKRENIQIAQTAQQAEKMRLFYVALTRAKHRCVVYWAAIKGGGRSPLASVLHSGLGDGEVGDRFECAAELFEGLNDSEMLIDLKALEARSSGNIFVQSQEEVPACRYRVSRGPRMTPQPRTFLREGLDRWWRRTSFSSLTDSAPHDRRYDGSPESEGRDHADKEIRRASDAPGAGASEAAVEELLPLAKFPRGADAGTFLHRVLELLDFQQAPNDLPRILDDEMGRHGIPEIWNEPLIKGIGQALATSFEGSGGRATCSLSDISRRDRIDEMTFDFPMAGGHYNCGGDSGVTAKAIVAALASDPQGLSRTDPEYLKELKSWNFWPPARGFLTGAIDLIFRDSASGADARYSVVDYKSNWLGERRIVDGEPVERCVAEHYTREAMQGAMRQHHYYLQYHLYTVALHRYLRWRLGPSYDYDRHIGGVYYLFVRGMNGRRDLRGQPYGVFFDRPPRAVIEALSAVFSDGSQGGPMGDRSRLEREIGRPA